MDVLQGLTDAFSALIDGINVLIDGIGGFIGDLIYVGELTASFVVRVPSYLSWLPDTVISVFVVGFGIVVTYKILGREG